MRAAAVFLLAIGSGCIYDRDAIRPERAAPSQPTAIDFLPGGMQFVVHVDVTRVRGTAVARTFVRLGARDREVLPTITALGVEPLRDLDRLVVAGRYEEEVWVAFGEHHLDADKTHRLIDAILAFDDEPTTREVVGGHEVIRRAHVAAVVVHDHLLAFVPPNRVPALLGDLEAGHGSRSDRLVRRFLLANGRPPTSHPPFLVAVGETPPELPSLDDEGIPELPPPSTVSAWAALADGLEVELRGSFPEAGSAERAGDGIRQLLDLEGQFRAYATLAGMEPLLRGAHVTVRGPRVSLNVRVSQADLEGMLARAELMVDD